eukprot:m.28004 g.28004  ORF g.28004 m.28004 type:complete len:93 (-) comp13508_c0_seq1:16-294(-)
MSKLFGVIYTCPSQAKWQIVTGIAVSPTADTVSEPRSVPKQFEQVFQDMAVPCQKYKSVIFCNRGTEVSENLAQHFEVSGNTYRRMCPKINK